jgi:hypothetical protein
VVIISEPCKLPINNRTLDIRKVHTMSELNVPQSMENGNSIDRPNSPSLRAVSKAAGDLERYKARVLRLYAHHSIKQICEILRREDKIIVR